MGTRYTTGEDAAGIFAHPTLDDLSIAVTEYELRTLLGLLPPDDALPIASRGELFVLMPGSHTLRYVVALARMREAQLGPEDQEDASDAQEPTQAQDQPVPAPSPDRRLERAAEDLQAVAEGFMSQWEVDPFKFDHQNHAGDLVARVLGVLRRYDYLPEPVSADEDQRPPLRRQLNMEETARLREAVRKVAPCSTGAVTTITGHVLALLRSWTEGENR